MRVNFDLLYPNAANSIEDHRRKYDTSGYLTRALMARVTRPEDEFEDNQDGEDPPLPEANHLFPQTISIHAKKTISRNSRFSAFVTTKDEPTFELQFRDISEDPEDYDFDRGFNLVYKNFHDTSR